MDKIASSKLKELAHTIEYENEEGHLPYHDLFEYVHTLVTCLSEMSGKIEYIQDEIDKIKDSCK